MIVGALAPAKINLGLEVLGRRPDGFHEIRTILAAISLYDQLVVDRGEVLRVESDLDISDEEQNLVSVASRQVQRKHPHVLPLISLRKRIPIASGLGGGSSDAAAAVLAIDRLYDLRMARNQLHETCSAIGSDVPFFLSGGIALAGGRGDLLELRRIERELHVVIVAPHHRIPNKTATQYRNLVPADFSDGRRIADSVEVGWQAWLEDTGALQNAFERPLYALEPVLRELPLLIRASGARAVGLAGAGPAHFALEHDREHAVELGRILSMSLRDKASVHVARIIPNGATTTTFEDCAELATWFEGFDHN